MKKKMLAVCRYRESWGSIFNFLEWSILTVFTLAGGLGHSVVLMFLLPHLPKLLCLSCLNGVELHTCSDFNLHSCFFVDLANPLMNLVIGLMLSDFHGSQWGGKWIKKSNDCCSNICLANECDPDYTEVLTKVALFHRRSLCAKDSIPRSGRFIVRPSYLMLWVRSRQCSRC